MSDDVIVPRGTAQAVLDIATSSMDFSSGFLDDEEVDALRAFAEILGVDPIDATPHAMQCKYRGAHDFAPMMANKYEPVPYQWCRCCGVREPMPPTPSGGADHG